MLGQQEMEQQVKILTLERDLIAARQNLGDMRKVCVFFCF